MASSMVASKKKSGKDRMPVSQLEKTATGISGFDDITFGGLPTSRPTLLVGRAGCGKTLFSIEFLARGALEFGEPGVMMTFEETAGDLVANTASLGFDLAALTKQKMLVIDYVRVERQEIEETGEYDLEGLFVRLNHAIDSVGAKRVVLDTIESLFAGFDNEAILRSELRRLFQWLKAKGVTAIITGERGKESLTRHGLEEYVADCVIVLDHSVNDRLATRRLRIVKYRGSMHGPDEYPFLIDTDGISVLPLTSIYLDYEVNSERVSSGVASLDAMLGGKGFFRGTSILLSGSPGTGKTSLAAHFADGASRRGERTLFFAFEESPAQIIRNMQSLGIDLGKAVKQGRLLIQAQRPSAWGLEQHLAHIHKQIEQFKPTVVIIDPISNLSSMGSSNEVKSMLIRLIGFLKKQQITGLFTHLVSDAVREDPTHLEVSSLMDSWVLLQFTNGGYRRMREVTVLKSRGMSHSNEVREFTITSSGVEVLDVRPEPEAARPAAKRIVDND